MLRKGTTILDVIGQVGFDPGTEWGTGLASTADNTLRRKTSISAGDANGSDAFDPSTEWDGYANDDISGLGSHAFAPIILGGVTVTLTVTDECGNTSTCSAYVTVVDNIDPMIDCPNDTTINCTVMPIPANTGTPTATDNCTLAPELTYVDATVAGDCPQEYSITRTWTAMDESGNTATCIQLIMVQDTLPPVFSCPANVTVSCAANVPPVAVYNALDNCSGEVPVTLASQVTTDSTCINQKVITRTYQAVDACGNSASCQQVITVFDGAPPVFSCPANVTVSCASNVPPVWTDGIASDNCGDVPVTLASQVTTDSTCVNQKVITRTYQAVDACGNSSSCMQTITVFDNTPPAITCPVNVTIECTASTDPAVNTALGMATATDGCGGMPVIGYTDATTEGNCPQEYTISRTWTATDACGNSTNCVQVITVDDSTPPVITCPPTLTLECSVEGNYTEENETIATWLASATATDACGEVTISDNFSPTAFSDGCGATGSQTVFFTATDECGNTSGCSALIQIVDTTPPVCQTTSFSLDTVIDPATGIITLDPMWFDDGSYDEGGDVTLAVFPTTVACEDEGTILVTLTVTDECGNSSTCTANFTLNCIDPCLEIITHVYLEGSATDPNGEETWTVPMRTTLNNLRILPGQTYVDPFFGNFYSPPGQPYNVAPWNYMGNEGDGYDSGGDPMMGDANYPPTVVDWVLVSLREDTTSAPLCQAAALLHADGHVEFVEAFECCDLDVRATYFVVIEHHNHLIVMSDEQVSVDLMNSTITYDFRNQDSYLDNPFMFSFIKGQKQIIPGTPGTWAMYAGNGEQSVSGAADIDINQDDRAAWQGENGDFGLYRFGDYNMNGDVNFNDRVTWERNNGNSSSVPRD